MRLWFSRLVLLTAVASAAAFAQAPESTPPAFMTLSMHGTIDRYDAATRTVTLSTFKGPVRFSLASLARIRRDGKLVAASSLQTLVGCRAVVRYSESGGTRTVESVHVFGKNKR